MSRLVRTDQVGWNNRTSAHCLDCQCPTVAVRNHTSEDRLSGKTEKVPRALHHDAPSIFSSRVEHMARILEARLNCDIHRNFLLVG